MTTVFKTPRPTGRSTRVRSRRSAWRQRLVEAERGVTLGFRGDSTLFVHFFSGSVILATAIVLPLTLVEWAVLVLGLTTVVAAEMFNKVMVEIGRHLPDDADNSVREGLKIGTAAVFVTIIGTVTAIALIFAPHVWELFHA
jgi:diacylglycerol kinase